MSRLTSGPGGPGGPGTYMYLSSCSSIYDTNPGGPGGPMSPLSPWAKYQQKIKLLNTSKIISHHFLIINICFLKFASHKRNRCYT